MRIIDGYVHFLGDGGVSADFFPFLVEKFSWPRFLLVQVWLMVLFMIYVTIHELNTMFGDGELPRCSFAGARRRRSSRAGSGSAC